MRQLRPLSFEFTFQKESCRIDFYRSYYKIMVKEVDTWGGGLALAVAGSTDDPRVFRPMPGVRPSTENTCSLIHAEAVRAVRAGRKNKRSVKARSMAFDKLARDFSPSKGWAETIEIKVAMGTA